MSSSARNDPVLTFANAAEWEAWLEEHHATATGAVLKIAKKRSGVATITVQEALEVALCFGWIDSVRRAHDERYFLQRYSPRTKRSNWSAINRAKAEALIAAGRMRPAGLAQIEAAKADGRWPEGGR